MLDGFYPDNIDMLVPEGFASKGGNSSNDCREICGGEVVLALQTTPFENPCPARVKVGFIAMQVPADCPK